MEQFHDRDHVRLRSRVHGTYLHADEDGRGVSLQPTGASLTAVWTVHLEGGSPQRRLLLHSAAYGRYLAATGKPGPSGLRGHRVALINLDRLDDESVSWEAVRTAKGDDVLLRHAAGRNLRANHGAGATVDDRYSRMLLWVDQVVEAIPSADSVPRPPPISRVSTLHPLPWYIPNWLGAGERFFSPLLRYLGSCSQAPFLVVFLRQS